MLYKHHNKEFKDDAILYWELCMVEGMTHKRSAEFISEMLGQSVSETTIVRWLNNTNYEEGKKGVKRRPYKVEKSNKLLKEEYAELVVFVDDLMLTECNLKIENERLKKIIADMPKMKKN